MGAAGGRSSKLLEVCSSRTWAASLADSSLPGGRGACIAQMQRRPPPAGKLGCLATSNLLCSFCLCRCASLNISDCTERTVHALRDHRLQSVYSYWITASAHSAQDCSWTVAEPMRSIHMRCLDFREASLRCFSSLFSEAPKGSIERGPQDIDLECALWLLFNLLNVHCARLYPRAVIIEDLQPIQTNLSQVQAAALPASHG